MNSLEKAILLATIAHDTKDEKQIDADGMPHIVHALDVMAGVKRELEVEQFGRRSPVALPCGYTIEEMLIAAVLHDVVEDTIFDLDYIRCAFGDKVADAVDGVTRRHIEPTCTNPDCDETTHKESYRDFIYRAAAIPASKIIKRADLGSNRRRTHCIKQAKWRNKLEYKYDISLRVLSFDNVHTGMWEQLSWEWKAGTDTPMPGHFFIADPYGKRIEITSEEFEKIRVTFDSYIWSQGEKAEEQEA